MFNLLNNYLNNNEIKKKYENTDTDNDNDNEWELLYKNNIKKDMNNILNEVIDRTIIISNENKDNQLEYIKIYVNGIDFKVLSNDLEFGISKLLIMFENFILKNMEEGYFNYLSI
jgi:hypothetical protein